MDSLNLDNRQLVKPSTGFGSWKRTYLLALPAIIALVPHATFAQHDLEPHKLEEIFITGEITGAATDTALPITTLADEDLRKASSTTLGSTLQHQLGVNSASFGTGVGRPVIRGQSGARVSVIQNGINTMDAASASQDHANSVDSLVAERIEIIRGPATLLYGNGAIGGVVNVIDNRIPDSLPTALTGAAEFTHDTVSSGESTAFKLENSLGNFAWHIDGAYRTNDDTEIPGVAESDEDHDDHEHHDSAEEAVGNAGIIPNSNNQSKSFAAGGSWIGENGFAGFSVSRLEKEYGLPPGSHLHVDHDHHDDEHSHEDEHLHDDEGGHDHEDEHDHEHHESHADEDIRIDLQQTRYEFKSAFDTAGFFTRIKAQIAYNDYEHIEFVQEDSDAHSDEHDEHEHDDEHHHGEHGTRFTNRGIEGRFTAHYSRDGFGNTAMEDSSSNAWKGIVGMQISDSEFAVEGEEGFLPPTDIQSIGIFALESINSGRWIYELGARVQQVKLSPKGGCAREDSSWSANAAAIWRMTDNINTSISVGRAQRSAGVEERYSNVSSAGCGLAATDEWKLHSPTGLIELGNPDLEKETSNNIELSLHKHLGIVHGELNAYFNRANDYIYLAETGQFIDGNAVALYQQRDAEFYGYEAEATVPLKITADQQLEFTVFSDSVHAEFTTGEYIPRIPPRRFGLLLELISTEWSVGLRTTRVANADHLASGEHPTSGYTLLELDADYHTEWLGKDVLVFAQGTNLLDEDIRNHVSFTKDLAPEPGRGIKAGVRLSF